MPASPDACVAPHARGDVLRWPLAPHHHAAAMALLGPVFCGAMHFLSHTLRGTRAATREVSFNVVGPPVEPDGICGWTECSWDAPGQARVRVVVDITVEDDWDAWCAKIVERAGPREGWMDDPIAGMPDVAYRAQLLEHVLIHELAHVACGPPQATDVPDLGHGEAWLLGAQLLMRHTDTDRATLEAAVLADHFGLEIDAAKAIVAHRPSRAVQ